MIDRTPTPPPGAADGPVQTPTPAPGPLAESGPGTEERARAHLAAIIESSEDAIISKDLNGIIQSWNQGAERIFYYTAAETIGRSITILIPPEDLAQEETILSKVRRGERIEHFETIRLRKDGSRVEISLSVSPVRDSTGRIIGASKIARDISERRSIEEQLRRQTKMIEQAYAEALAASRAKDEFLAALSHELRTPLTPALLLASESEEDDSLAPEVRARFAAIRSHVELESRLIDDLLDLTRISRGKLNMEMTLVRAHPLLELAVQNVRADLIDKGLQLHLALSPDEPLIQADSVRFQQILWNLLNNAVKFTPPGGSINVQTQIRPETDELVITVSDSGIGITPAELARIFDAFAQGEHAQEDHRFGGLGLGLAICQKLVEFQGGRIEANSPGRDQGATFTVTFPLAHPPERSEPPTARHLDTLKMARAAPRRRVLLVEDHTPTRQALERLLQRRDYEVQAAPSVATALALAERESFDLVISDVGLPDGSGYDLMQQLRERYRLAGIALTGYGMEQDIVRSQESGFVAHLIKPVRTQLLDAALVALFAGAASE